MNAIFSALLAAVTGKPTPAPVAPPSPPAPPVATPPAPPVATPPPPAALLSAIGATAPALSPAQRATWAAAFDAPCRAAQADQSGPAAQYGFDFPDPFVLTVGTNEYAFGTNVGDVVDGEKSRSRHR